MTDAAVSGKKRLSAILGCLVVMLCVGIIYLWSVYKADIVASFNWDVPSANMVASYMLMGFVVGCLVGGILNDRIGPKITCVLGVVLFACGVGLTGLLTADNIRLLYLTYSVMGGLGSGLAYNATIPCVQKWMPGRRGLASGLAAAAFGLSTLVFSPVSKALMTRFTDAATGLVNFKPVFLILAGVFLVVGLAACVFVCAPPAGYGQSSAKSGGKLQTRDYNLGQAMKTVPFWCLFGVLFFINGTWNLTVPLIKDLGLERGLTETMAVFAVSFTGIPNALGRLVCAYLSDKIGRGPMLMILSVATIAGALLMTVAGGPWYIVVVAVIAFCYGGPSPVNAAFCTDFFGAKNAGTNYGFLMLALGLSSIFFNAISNNILGGSPVPTFIMAACTALVSIVFLQVINRYIKKEKAAERAA